MSKKKSRVRRPVSQAANRAHETSPARDAREAREETREDLAHFELHCACGTSLRGEQPASLATVTCPNCGTRLPLSSVVAADAIGAGPASAARQPSEVEPQGPVDSDALPPAVLEARGAGSFAAKRRIRLSRLIMAASLLIVLATAIWSVSRYRRQAARVALATDTTLGRTALEAGDFQDAARTLTAARRAAARLGIGTPLARKAVQYEREAFLWSHLTPRPLDEFFLQHGTSGDAEASKSFEREYAGRTVIFDGWLRRDERAANPSDDREHKPAAGKSPPSPPALHFDWALAGEGFEVELALDGVRAFDWLDPGVPRRVLFGAQLASVERMAADRGKWRLHLVAESCGLLTLAGPLRHWHWPDEASWSRVLDEQRARLELEP